MELNIKNINDISRQDILSFCENNPKCWLHHKGIIMMPERENLSFVIVSDDKILAFCPMSVEIAKIADKEYRIGSFWGLSLPAPVIDYKIQGKDLIKQITVLIYNEIKIRSQKHNIAKIKINTSASEFVRQGFMDVSLKTIWVDLRVNEEEAWKNLSKGHRSTLKKYIDDCHYEYQNHQNTKFLREPFIQTMLTIGFLMNDYLDYLFMLYQEGNVEICNAYCGDKLVGSAVFLKSHKTVEYHQGQRFIVDDIPVHHLIVWNGMNKYRRDGFEFMDLGVFTYHSQINYINSKKNEQVAVFKRGFGGDVLPLELGEKYFDPEYFQREYDQRIARFKETIDDECKSFVS